MTDATQEFSEDESSAPTGPGDLVEDRYRLEERIGGGVTAVTWRAHDPVLGRDVAIKLWSDSSVDAHRSQQDELGAARLLDPNLNELLDAGTHDGRPFLVREIALEHPADPAPPPSSPVTTMSAPVTPPAGGPPVPGARRRDRVVTASVAAIVLAIVLVVAGLIVRPDSGQPGESAADGAAISPTEITAFDPDGDGQENPDELGALLDGDPSTTWRSDRYNTRKFGNLKPGLGLVLSVSPARELDALKVVSQTGGWSAQVHVAETPRPELAGWGEAVDEVAGAAASEEFALGGRTVGAVLIWFTDLGTESNRLTIADVQVVLE